PLWSVDSVFGQVNYNYVSGFFIGPQVYIAAALDSQQRLIVVSLQTVSSNDLTASSNDLAVGRFDLNGNSDPGFASGGKITTDIVGPTDTYPDQSLTQPDGKILVLCSDNTSILLRYDPDG